ncbi:hypothetical protein [Planctomyces sp. SH-PL14]|uniref:hypothetical protein n=1 Tax=Planctomyces sp. SH-PL14 TaxID=1632864 RepID=UPI00078E696F|nr:hypothetical protein [Planctomyces sp. SH-PL14]AMV20845.1 hypothetical protein VT03_23285 [Planctomyces sp. SH-PL14]
MTNSLLHIAAIGLALSIPHFSALADDPTSTSPTSEAEAKIRVATQHITQCEATLATGKPLDRIEKPLITYGDPVRQNDNGTLWAWGRAGRPKCFLELYQSDENRGFWIHAVSLTSTDLVEMRAPLSPRWTPKAAAFKPAPITGPPIGDSERVRLRQMKEIAGRLKAHEFWDPDNSRYELRLLIQPVHRYADPAAGILDGTVFVFAHGTNPEILVLIEATGPEPASATWKLAAARMGSAELHLSLGDEEVWSAPRTPNVVGRPEDPYWLFLSRADAAPAPAAP